MLFLIGTFGLNFPIFISAMAVNVFHSDARGFGLLSSIMALGTLSGSLFAAGRRKPGLASLLAGAGVLGSAALWLHWILVVWSRSHSHRRGRPDFHKRYE